MRPEDFRVQMLRLIDTYGKDKYPSERLKVFWERFGSGFDDVFKSAIDYCIAHYQKPPMVDDIGKAIGKIKEEIREEEKRQYNGTASGFFNLAEESPDDEVRLRVTMIRKRMCGDVADEAWGEFMYWSKGKACHGNLSQ